jgi:RNase P subunit RPR2
MTLADASFAAGQDLPITTCPTCYPPRPIKTILMPLRRKSQTIVFECPACGATMNITPTADDTTDGSATKEGPPAP